MMEKLEEPTAVADRAAAYDPSSPMLRLSDSDQFPEMSDGETVDSDASLADSAFFYIESDPRLRELRQQALAGRQRRLSLARGSIKELADEECSLKEFQRSQKRLKQRIRRSESVDERCRLFVEYCSNSPLPEADAAAAVVAAATASGVKDPDGDDMSLSSDVEQLSNEWIIIDEEGDDSPTPPALADDIEVDDEAETLATASPIADEAAGVARASEDEEELTALRQLLINSMRAKRDRDSASEKSATPVGEATPPPAPMPTEEATATAMAATTIATKAAATATTLAKRPATSRRTVTSLLKMASASSVSSTQWKPPTASTSAVPSRGSLRLVNRRQVVCTNLNSREVREDTRKRFIIMLDGDDDSEDDGHAGPDEAQQQQQQQQQYHQLDDKEKLEQLKRSVQTRAVSLQERLASDKDQLVQRRLRHTQRLKSLTRRRESLTGLRSELKRAFQLFALLRNRVTVADRDVRKLESSINKEQRLLQSRESQLKQREAKVLQLLQRPPQQQQQQQRGGLPTLTIGDVDPFVPLCPFFLNGQCRDAACELQHPGLVVSAAAVDTVADTQPQAPPPTRLVAPSARSSIPAVGVYVKEWCDSCRTFVCCVSQHLRQDKFCSTCVATVAGSADSSPSDWLQVVHHFVCRLRIYQQRGADTDELVARAEAFAHEAYTRFPDNVALIEHSLDFKRMNRRSSIPISLLKALVKRVADYGVVRRCLRLLPDFPSQRQLHEFALSLPDLACRPSEYLQLVLHYCRLLQLANSGLGVKSFLLNFLTGEDARRLGEQHASFLWLCLLHHAAAGCLPPFPPQSPLSPELLQQELLVLAGVGFGQQQQQLEDMFHKMFAFLHGRQFDSIGDIVDANCAFLMSATGSASTCPYRLCIDVVFANFLLLQRRDCGAYCRLLAVRKAQMGAVPLWLRSTEAPLSPQRLLLSSSAAVTQHGVDLAHSVVYHAVAASADCQQQQRQWLQFAIEFSYESAEAGSPLLMYRHLLGLLDNEEQQRTIGWCARQRLGDMLADSQLHACINYASLQRLLSGVHLHFVRQLMSLSPSLSCPVRSARLLQFALSAAKELQHRPDYEDAAGAACRELLCLLRPGRPPTLALQLAIVEALDAVDYARLQLPDVLRLLLPLHRRCPTSYQLLKAICEKLIQEKRALQDAYGLCVEASRFHRQRSVEFWQMYRSLLTIVFKQTARPQLELLERSVQSLPLSKYLWNEYLRLATEQRLQKTLDRVRASMDRLGIDCDCSS